MCFSRIYTKINLRCLISTVGICDLGCTHMWHLYPSPHSNHTHRSVEGDWDGTSQRPSNSSGGNKLNPTLLLYGHMVCKIKVFHIHQMKWYLQCSWLAKDNKTTFIHINMSLEPSVLCHDSWYDQISSEFWKKKKKRTVIKWIWNRILNFKIGANVCNSNKNTYR